MPTLRSPRAATWGIVSSRRAARLYLILLAAAIVTVGAHATAALPPIPAKVAHATRLASATYGVPLVDLLNVAWCESRWTRGSGDGTADPRNLFQITATTWRRTPYRHFSPLDVIANALAAAWLVKQDGGWHEWTCKPSSGFA